MVPPVRDAAIWVVLAVVVALAIDPRRSDVALGVLGGALLAAVSAWTVAATVDGLLAALARDLRPPARRRRVALAAALLLVRYALLAGMAYVMMARLRWHPLGLLAGATAPVAAAAMDAWRRLHGKAPPRALDRHRRQ
jgi:hypothetical protein